MIPLTRLDGAKIVINCDHILYGEQTPDTLLTLTNGSRLTVREPMTVVVERVLAWRNRIRPAVELREGDSEHERAHERAHERDGTAGARD